jgi:hypothetical protein
MTRQLLPMDAALRCTIRAEGMLDPGWSDRLGGLRIRSVAGRGRPTTVLSGRLQDQAALVGVLVALYDLGLPLVSVTCCPVPGAGAEGGTPQGVHR